MPDVAIAHIAQDNLSEFRAKENEQKVPQLTGDMARFFSFYIETGDMDRSAKAWEADTGYKPPLGEWLEDPEFQAGLELYHGNRRALFHAMSYALFGPAWRSLGKMIENPKTADKGITLLARMHGILIDRVKQEDPGQLAAIWAVLQQRAPIQETQRFSIKEVE